MTDSIPSDHEAVTSRRVTLASIGRTRRLQLQLPEDLSCSPGDIVSLSLSGENYYARVESTLDGEPVITGAFANRRLARTGDGENLFQEWVADSGRSAGQSVTLDVLREGFAYGVRLPGERVVYHPPEPPTSSLADIARSLDDDAHP